MKFIRYSFWIIIMLKVKDTVLRILYLLLL